MDRDRFWHISSFHLFVVAVLIHELLNDAYVLTGPTGSGKSALGLALAERLNAEIICMDSMVVYRGMDTGTAKPTREERQRIPHHVLDVLDPWENGSVAWWLRDAKKSAADISKRGKRVLIVGGTPLYLKAFVHGMFAGPPVDRSLRQELESQSIEALRQKLTIADPVAAQRIHRNDRKRLVRALEIYQQTQRPISSLQQQFQTRQRLQHTPLWLNWPRELLYQRIENRTDAMLAQGWLEEVRNLLALPRSLSKEAAQAAGYRELADHLHGKMSWEQTVTTIKTRTRQLAKRQLTWLRNFPGLEPVNITGQETLTELADDCLKKWGQPASN
jgi:tRNA dimethylallyltransferase